MLTFTAILITIAVAVIVTLPDVQVWWVVGPAVVVALVGPALFYPISFTLWQAIDLWMRPTDPGGAGRNGRRPALIARPGSSPRSLHERLFGNYSVVICSGPL